MKKIVTKFGGSSLADAGQFAKVKSILLMDSARQYVVPSAPGRRFKEDDKVTDLLYRCCRQAHAGEDFQDTFPVCEEITWRKCRNTNLWQRLLRAALRIFAPLM